MEQAQENGKRRRKRRQSGQSGRSGRSRSLSLSLFLLLSPLLLPEGPHPMGSHRLTSSSSSSPFSSLWLLIPTEHLTTPMSSCSNWPAPPPRSSPPPSSNKSSPQGDNNPSPWQPADPFTATEILEAEDPQVSQQHQILPSLGFFHCSFSS